MFLTNSRSIGSINFDETSADDDDFTITEASEMSYLMINAQNPSRSYYSIHNSAATSFGTNQSTSTEELFSLELDGHPRSLESDFSTGQPFA